MKIYVKTNITKLYNLLILVEILIICSQCVLSSELTGWQAGAWSSSCLEHKFGYQYMLSHKMDVSICIEYKYIDYNKNIEYKHFQMVIIQDLKTNLIFNIVDI